MFFFFFICGGYGLPYHFLFMNRMDKFNRSEKVEDFFPFSVHSLKTLNAFAMSPNIYAILPIEKLTYDLH